MHNCWGEMEICTFALPQWFMDDVWCAHYCFFIYMECSVCAQQEQGFPFLLNMWGTISSFCFLESYWIQSHNAKPVKPVNQRLLTLSTLSPSVYSGSVELLPINIHPHQLNGSSSENSFSASQHKPQTHQMKNSSHEIIAEEDTWYQLKNILRLWYNALEAATMMNKTNSHATLLRMSVYPVHHFIVYLKKFTFTESQLSRGRLHIPGADDLLGGVSSWQLFQQIVGEIYRLQVEETPGHHRGESSQAVGRQIQVCDTWRQVHEPVQFQPGQL